MFLYQQELTTIIDYLERQPEKTLKNWIHYQKKIKPSATISDAEHQAAFENHVKNLKNIADPSFQIENFWEMFDFRNYMLEVQYYAESEIAIENAQATKREQARQKAICEFSGPKNATDKQEEATRRFLEEYTDGFALLTADNKRFEAFWASFDRHTHALARLPRPLVVILSSEDRPRTAGRVLELQFNGTEGTRLIFMDSQSKKVKSLKAKIKNIVDPMLENPYQAYSIPEFSDQARTFYQAGYPDPYHTLLNYSFLLNFDAHFEWLMHQAEHQKIDQKTLEKYLLLLIKECIAPEQYEKTKKAIQEILKSIHPQVNTQTWYEWIIKKFLLVLEYFGLYSPPVSMTTPNQPQRPRKELSDFDKNNLISRLLELPNWQDLFMQKEPLWFDITEIPAFEDSLMHIENLIGDDKNYRYFQKWLGDRKFNKLEAALIISMANEAPDVDNDENSESDANRIAEFIQEKQNWIDRFSQEFFERKITEKSLRKEILSKSASLELTADEKFYIVWKLNTHPEMTENERYSFIFSQYSIHELLKTLKAQYQKDPKACSLLKEPSFRDEAERYYLEWENDSTGMMQAPFDELNEWLLREISALNMSLNEYAESKNPDFEPPSPQP